MALDEARNSTVKAFPLVQGRETWGSAVEGLSVAELSQRNQTTILRAMASVSQARVSEVMGVSESTLSRMKDEQLERFSTMLASCGLAVRPCSDRSIEAEKLRALTVLARSALDDEIVNWSKD